LINELKAIHLKLLQAPKQFLLVCEEHLSERLLKKFKMFGIKLKLMQLPEIQNISHSENDHDEAWLIQTNVQFCASAYQAIEVAHPDAAPLMVLAAYLRNGYLHSAIREKGGAYGGGASYDGNACSFRFYSYRDPRLAETFKDFEASVQWFCIHSNNPINLKKPFWDWCRAWINQVHLRVKP
jgi:Zn-dependent M16 (insulinase) family peptidase